MLDNCTICLYIYAIETKNKGIQMTEEEIEKYSHLLSDAFRKGIIHGLEDYGDNRLVPEPEKILEAARNVLQQEGKDVNLRSHELLRREAIRVNMDKRPLKYPCPEDIPFLFEKYSYLGGLYFLDDVDMSIEDGLRCCIADSIFDWLMKLK